MALVKYGGGVVGMAGKIAGNVHARNRYGQYVRAWAKPVNPNTERQNGIRTLAATLGSLWANTLTAAQRAGWNEYAANVPVTNRLGEVMHLSGFNHFYRSNAARLHAGFIAGNTAPTLFTLGDTDPDFDVAVASGTQDISITFDDGLPWVNSPDEGLIIYAGMPQNPGVSFFGGPFRQAGRIVGDDVTAPSVPQVLAMPFVVGAGQKVFIEARITHVDGRLSERMRAEAIAT